MARRVAVLNVVGLTGKVLDSGAVPALARFAAEQGRRAVRPAFPAVTCTAQATYATGRPPRDHGAVANGWYDRDLAEHQFWKQPERLVAGPKLWDVLRDEVGSGSGSGLGFTCAKLFWWYNRYSTADLTVTPRPIYRADGGKVFDIDSAPRELGNALKQELGDFPFTAFWGPRAGIASTEWIARAAQQVESDHSPTLSLVYLPHLDYDLQRHGEAAVATAGPQVDAVFGELLDFYRKREVAVVVLSEYGIADVERPVHLNRVLRSHGWLETKPELGLEMADLGSSNAFAIADHQVAHVYVREPELVPEVRAALEATPGVGRVLGAAELAAAGLDHPRSGELVAEAEADSWFTYYYWDDDAVAPDFARCVDIHRKIGYDPAELFLDPQLPFPKLKTALRLAQSKLGFRTLFDVIPLDASLVKGSHGRVPENQADWPVLFGDGVAGGDAISATDVFNLLHDAVTEA